MNLLGAREIGAERMSDLGKWSVLPIRSNILAVHAALLKTGEVLYFSGSQHIFPPSAPPEAFFHHTEIWTPSSGAVRKEWSPSHDPLMTFFAVVMPFWPTENFWSPEARNTTLGRTRTPTKRRGMRIIAAFAIRRFIIQTSV
jgi:hypothetical protein